MIDATRWVEDDLFWPAFLLHVGMAASAQDAFDVDLADLAEYLERFERADRWPVFAVPVGDGVLHLVVRNLPDDVGIDWLVDSGVDASVDQLAAEIGGYRPGPGLPWELLPREPEHLLLALPAIGDTVVPDGVVEQVADALRAVSTTSCIYELAKDLLDHRACMLQ